MQETQVQSLDQEDSPEKGMATYSSILPWEIPLTEKPGVLQSTGWQRVEHNWATNTFTFKILKRAKCREEELKRGRWQGVLKNEEQDFRLSPKLLNQNIQGCEEQVAELWTSSLQVHVAFQILSITDLNKFFCIAICHKKE